MDTPVILTFNFFAIQDWKEQGNIVRQHVPGVINPADDVTKPLGWMLPSRHARGPLSFLTPRWGLVSMFMCHPCLPSTLAPGC